MCLIELNVCILFDIYAGMMFFLPVATFYICYWYVFVEKTNPDAWAGGAAVIVANLVLAHYVVTAFAEDDDEVSDKDNDQYGPRTGVFKQRTD